MLDFQIELWYSSCQKGTTMKAMTSRQYVADGGSSCPACKSKDITGGGYGADGTMVWTNITCLACGAMWTDVYRLIGYDSLTKKGKKQ